MAEEHDRDEASAKDSAPESRRVAPLARAVRQRRRALGLRQVEVADLAGCSERFVHTMEHGKDSLRLDKVLDVLAVLGLGLVVGPGHGKVDVAGASLAGSDDGR
jgi:y4mF family transcriptional regulator